MRILFILNTFFELVVAITSVVLFDNLLLAGNALSLTTLSALSINATDPKVIRPALLTFVVFHTAITAAWLLTFLRTGTFNPAIIGHGLFAVAFGWTLLRYRRNSRLP